MLFCNKYSYIYYAYTQRHLRLYGFRIETFQKCGKERAFYFETRVSISNNITGFNARRREVGGEGFSDGDSRLCSRIRVRVPMYMSVLDSPLKNVVVSQTVASEIELFIPRARTAINAVVAL